MNATCYSFLVMVALLLALFTSESHGTSISISSGDGSGTTGYASNYGTDNEDTIQDLTSLAGSSSVRYLTGSGSMDERHWTANIYGDHVAVGAKVIDAASYKYDYKIYPSEGSGWGSDIVYGMEWLNVSSANYINAYALAHDKVGNEAHANLEIYDGSLEGYYNEAYAGQGQWLGFNRIAAVYQVVDFASGNSVFIQTHTGNTVGDTAGSRTEIRNGRLDTYKARANSVNDLNGPRASGCQVDKLAASAPDGSIYQLMWAKDNWQDISQVSTYINKGYIYDYPYMSNYPSLAYSVTDWKVTYAAQSANVYGNYEYSNGYAYEVWGYSHDVGYGPYNYNTRYNGQVKFWNDAATSENGASALGGLL